MSTTVWSILIGFFGLVISILGFLYGRADAARKNSKEQIQEIIKKTTQEVTIGQQISQMSAQVSDMSQKMCGQFSALESRMKDSEESASKRLERLAKVEASTASAHHRLDEVCDRVGTLERKQMNA